MYGAVSYGTTPFAAAPVTIASGGPGEGAVIAIQKTEPPRRLDLELTVGDTFNLTFLVISDLRIKVWRGAWHEWFIYEPGEAVETSPGEIFVCTERTLDCKPDSADGAEFWSAATPLNIEGQVTLICGDQFILSEGHGLTVENSLGRINIEVTPAQTESTPSSESYRLHLAGAKQSTLIRGTALFRQP